MTISNPQQNTDTPDRRYVYILSFADVEEKNGVPAVRLLNHDGACVHADPLVWITFTKPFLPTQVFSTTLNDPPKNTPVRVINVVAEFTESLFNEYVSAIPTLGSWESAEPSDGRNTMNPTGPPGRG